MVLEDGHLCRPQDQELRYLLGIAAPYGTPRGQISPHRAASDVPITAAILEELMKQVRWGQLVEWSFEPPLHTRLHFGRHRGERYDAVPVDYLEWILASDLNASVKHSAQHWLKQRSGQK
jgi:exodeoxyribonuclease X